MQFKEIEEGILLGKRSSLSSACLLLAIGARIQGKEDVLKVMRLGVQSRIRRAQWHVSTSGSTAFSQETRAEDGQ